MAAPRVPSTPTVVEAVVKYRESLGRRQRAGKMSGKTVENYTQDLLDFERIAGPDVVLDAIEVEDLDDIFAGYGAEPDRRYRRAAAAGRSVPTRGVGAQARFGKSVSALFTHAERQGWIRVNPIPDCESIVKAPKVSPESRAGLSPEKAAALLASSPVSAGSKEHHSQRSLAIRDHLIIRMMIETGLRVSELTNANRADLSERSGATWLTVVGKGSKTRSVPISGPTMDVYTLYNNEKVRPAPHKNATPAQTEDADDAMFLSWRGLRLTPRSVQRLLRQHGLNMDANERVLVVPHTLRHTAATLHLLTGATIKEVQTLLGHADLSTTGIYLEAFDENLALAVSRGLVASLPAPDFATGSAPATDDGSRRAA